MRTRGWFALLAAIVAVGAGVTSIANNTLGVMDQLRTWGWNGWPTLAPKTQPTKAESTLQASGFAYFRHCDICPEMVAIPVGAFHMGANADEAGIQKDEVVRHLVTVQRPFAIARHEVTFKDWDACTSAGACRAYVPGDEGWGRDSRPVIHVSWDDTWDYINWLNTKSSAAKFRLPTEGEWEYVARAGKLTPYYWGTDRDGGCAYANGADSSVRSERGAAWLDETSRCTNDGYGRRTAPVGSFKVNDFGVYDMIGNVYEWVEDCYRSNYDFESPILAERAENRGNCDFRVIRGGGWNSPPHDLRSANRYHVKRSSRDNMALGFRVVADIPASAATP